MPPLIEVKDLVVDIPIRGKLCAVVDHLNFTIEPGKIVAIVGESGCGKSMAAMSLLKLHPFPIRGEVYFENRNLLALSDKELRSIRGAKIAMIFQDPSNTLNPVSTIGSQLAEILFQHTDMDEEEVEEKIILTLAEVGIPAPGEMLDRYPHELSGGMKQRVLIAGALLCKPSILIADEPTTALDVTVQAQVLDLLRRLCDTHSMGVLLITHDMGVVAEVADEVIVMYAAKVVEKGNVNTIFRHMSHPYTKGLFASRPSIGQEGRLKGISGSVPAPNHFPTGCRFHPRCPFAMDKCREGKVPDFEIDPQHIAACWLYE
jgi:oligopeptide/dipeptide ABC transporter ATP-binding protein